jgi:gluconokinase
MAVLALDVGSSSARAAVYDDDGTTGDGRFHRQSYEPRLTGDGGVEHEAGAVLEAVAACIDAVLPAARGLSIDAVGIDTFWHGLLGLDAAGEPVTPLYMWGDTRSAEDARRLRATLDAGALHARTGCPLHSSFWPAKLRWHARTHPEVARRVHRWGSFGEYLFGRLFGEPAVSISMASGTGLLDHARNRWDDEALGAAGIDPARLFPLCEHTEARSGLRAPWAARWPALRRVAWFPAVGDGAASNVGSGCVDPSRLALNVGTSAALRLVTSRPGTPAGGLFRYKLDAGRAVVGGATSEGGNLYAWCRRVLALPAAEAVEAALDRAAPGGHGPTALPFLAGERAPGWRGDRSAALTGLSLDTEAIDVVRALLEAFALRLALIYEQLAPEAEAQHTIVASGGAVGRSRALARMIADALGRPLARVDEEEATGRGTALLALRALGAPVADPEPAIRDVVEPDAARGARYRDLLARQLRLDAALADLEQPPGV